MAATDVHLRVMRHDDIAAGLRLCRLANWNQVDADWRFFLASSPAGCFVVEDDAGTVIGSVATIAYGDVFSWIAMVLVDPEHRRGGIGTRLLNAALAAVGDATTARLDATPAGREVYVPLGFTDEYALQRMVRPSALARETQTNVGETRRSLREGGASTDDGGVVRRMTDADFAEVLRQDRDVFGADRGTLLAMCRREAPEYAWVIGDGRVDAYLFGRHGYTFEQIGPLVARDEPAARALVAACLSAHPHHSFLIDTPLRASWVLWLESQRFALQRPFMRMRRGEPRFQECLDRLFAMTGPEFG